MLTAKRALISVSDKTGLVEFARGLAALGVEILSTGGTRKFLEENDLQVTPVAEVTGFPEILDGRVKTLHPHIHGGILADRSRASHLSQLQQHGVSPIDLVVVNLYPFQRVADAEDSSFEQVIDMIDIGGPSMVRGAAKNFRGVLIVVDPADYPQILTALEEGGGKVPEAVRQRLAIKAFRHTQAYDAAIAAWLERQDGHPESQFPRRLHLDLVRQIEPRYGENPHQAAAVYRTLDGPGIFAGFEQLQGKELSWNNVLDADAARRLVALFDEPTVVIVKHNTPCGVGCGENLQIAYERALATDPVSAFGSVVAVNRRVDGAVAKEMKKLFIEVVVAPGYAKEALKTFTAKKSLRLLSCPPYSPEDSPVELRAIAGGYLAQVPDAAADDATGWECPTLRKPTQEEQQALEFAWKTVRHVKSNAIVITNRHQTVGLGAGQMSRVDACRLAVEKALLPTEGCVAASDAFFPFRDGLDVLADAGVQAIVQPGGSKRDQEVITAADERGLALVLTGVRHFRH